jgi:hypothetical protein
MVWPKLTVSDYREMLRKLSASAFVMTIICVSLLRSRIVAVEQFFHVLDADSAMIKVLGPISIPFGTFVAAFIVAIISESIKLHDRISGLLGIRAAFDLYRILVPMALLSGATVDGARFSRIVADRRRLMREVFYEYASSAKDADIDNHLVIQALTAWSWYWLFVESIVIIITTAAVLTWFGHWRLSTLMLAVAMVLQLIMTIFRSESNKYAEAEVSAILAKEDRRQAVRSVFDAL